MKDRFRTIFTTAFVVVSRAFSCILEPVNELYMFSEEDIAKFVIADIDDNLLYTVGVNPGIWLPRMLR